MHFVTFVVTDEKPTEKVLERVLQAFGPEGQERFDHWVVGGRFSGHVIPYDFANTITGGPDVASEELALLAELAGSDVVPRLSGLKPDAGLEALAGSEVVLGRPGSKPGAGGDVARFDNIETLGINPDAILINGEWRECEVPPYNEFLDQHAERFPDYQERVEAMLRDPELQQREEGHAVSLGYILA